MCNTIHLRAAEKKAFVGILPQIKLLFGPLVIQLVTGIGKTIIHLSVGVSSGYNNN